jgi:hypothetical protein
MRGNCGAGLAIATLLVAFAPQAQAGDAIAEASGNWAGPQGGGFYFRATLEGEADRARLKIWNGIDGVPDGGAPQLDVADFALTAFASDVRLEVVEVPDASILQIVVEFADEEAEGRDLVQLRYMDFQYTIVGYHHLSRFYNPGGEPIVTECKVDIPNASIIEDGTQRPLPPVDFESLNASAWHFGAAFDRGWCSRFDG